jgi:hypothetical protein
MAAPVAQECAIVRIQLRSVLADVVEFRARRYTQDKTCL